MTFRGAGRATVSFVAEWLPIAATVVIGPALVASAALVRTPKLTSSLRHGTDSDWLFRTGLLVLVIGSLFVAVRDRRRASRLRELATWQARAADSELALAVLARSEVRQLAESLRLHSNGRVSLFRAHMDDHFDLVARFSADPSKDHGPGRGSYPTDEGVLGQAWANQRAFPRSLPPPGPVNAAPFRQWVDAQQRQFGISEAEANSLALRARTYGAIRIDRDGRSLGVLVFEDTRSRESDEGDPASTTITETSVGAHLDAAAGARFASLLSSGYGVPCTMWAEYRARLGTAGPSH